MNGNSGAPPHLRNGSTVSIGRGSGGRGHMSTGSLNPPNGPHNGPHNAPRYDAARSPPGKQNTSHVPCKFFKQGQCQAGSACPFSHDLDNTADHVCKYFQKGNCKFGGKCANAHFLPDGTKVVYAKSGQILEYQIPRSMNFGGRMNPDQYPSQNSALTNGFMAHNGMASPYGAYPPMRNQEEGFPAQDSSNFDLSSVPQIDTSYASHQNSAYGSPRDEVDTRSQGLSPRNQVLNIRDVGLPPSYDSNVPPFLYSKTTKPGSVPPNFGHWYPRSSLSEDSIPSGAVKELHSSAFGDDTTRDRFNGVTSSPSFVPEGYFGKKPMHSQQRVTRPKAMSASVPERGIDGDWDQSDLEPDLGQECLPESLKELFTPPPEKFRRGSRNADDEGRPTYNGAGTPGDVASKVGSPSNASPSRWNSTFAQMKQRDEEEKFPRSSQFGHVGSPLRPSSLQAAIGSGAGSRPRSISRPDSASGDHFPSVASPPRQAQISLIAQGMQKVRLSASNERGQHVVGSPGSRITSNPSLTRRDLGAAGERAISSSSIGTSRFVHEAINEEHEEQTECVFNMDEDENETASMKRHSGGLGYPVGGRSPHLSALGGRASSSGLATNGNSGTNGNGNSNGNGNGSTISTFLGAP